MKDLSIFAIILTVLTCSAICATIDTSRTTTVDGSFAAYIARVDYQWAYLRGADKGEILDSCLIIDRKFTLSGEIPTKSYPCLITFSKLNIAPGLKLQRGGHIALQITADPSKAIEQTLEAIARHDLLHRAEADSLHQMETHTLESI